MINAIPNTEREFNTFGPVKPTLHYHVNRVAVKSEIRQKIEKGRYFTLNAARQTGKTTLFREVMAELTAEKAYCAILLTFEGLRQHPPARFYERLGEIIQQHFLAHQESLPNEITLRDHGDFSTWLINMGQQLKQPVILIIDEFDAIAPELAEPLLAIFREMYHYRYEPTFPVIQSIILVGVRNIPALLGGSQSPFNIADQYEVPYFTAEETTTLLSQHSAETGQPFDPAVLTAIYRETEGQPFLVNRLGQLLTQTIVPQRTETITPNHFNRALTDLLAENNTHFASMTAKATPHRSVLLPLLFYDERRSKFRDPVTQELLMCGILRRVRENNFWVARLANPIYRKMLILTFSPPNGELYLNGSFRHRYVIEGLLDIAGILDGFKEMMTEHGISLLRSNKTNRPLEIGGQYLLLSYLTAALDSIGGQVTLEAINSAGEMDVVVFYRHYQFIIETKIWYGQKRFEQGQQQLVNYLEAANLSQGYIVLFSERSLTEALGDRANEPFEVTVQDKSLRIYVIVIGR